VDVCIRGAWAAGGQVAAAAAASTARSLNLEFSYVLLGHSCVLPPLNPGTLPRPTMIGMEQLLSHLCSRPCRVALLSPAIPAAADAVSSAAAACDVAAALSSQPAPLLMPHSESIMASKLSPADARLSQARLYALFLPYVPSHVPASPPRLHNFPSLSATPPERPLPPAPFHKLSRGKVVVCVPTAGELQNFVILLQPVLALCRALCVICCVLVLIPTAAVHQATYQLLTSAFDEWRHRCVAWLVVLRDLRLLQFHFWTEIGFEFGLGLILSIRIIIWHMTGSSPASRNAHPSFTSEVQILQPSPSEGPTARFSHRNGTTSFQPLHLLFAACDIVLPMQCSPNAASAIVDSSFYAGVPVIPPPAGMACDASRSAVTAHGAIEWVSSPAAGVGRLQYSGIVRGLIAETSAWPVTGLFPPRLVRAKLRASSLAYWSGGRHMQSTFEVALERSLRLAVDARHCDQQAFRIVPSSAFDCRKVRLLRGGGGLNAYAFYFLPLCSMTHGDPLQVRGLDSRQVGAQQL
jgi:hypothetical protein